MLCSRGASPCRHLGGVRRGRVVVGVDWVGIWRWKVIRKNLIILYFIQCFKFPTVITLQVHKNVFTFFKVCNPGGNPLQVAVGNVCTSLKDAM